MTRIAILDDYQRRALASAPWESLVGCTVEVFERPFAGEDEAAEALAGFEVVVAMRERTRFPRSLLERLPALALLVTTGMRNLAIDLEAARQRGVMVCGTEMTSYAAFEHTWALLLALAKRIPEADRVMRAGGWQPALPGVGLAGKTLGVVGLGRLGAQVARVGLAFGMRVLAWSAHLEEGRCRECGVERAASLEALLAAADFVTLHLVLGERTRGLIGARELARMKPTAFLVNTARGPIVDETALIDALRHGVIAGAALDVYDQEPLPAGHPLRRLDNVVLSGHTGFVIEEMYRLAYGQAVEAISAWLAGRPLRVLPG